MLYLGIFNSKLIGYLIYQFLSQWGKGLKKEIK